MATFTGACAGSRRTRIKVSAAWGKVNESLEHKIYSHFSHQAHLRQHLGNSPNEDQGQRDDVNLRGEFDGSAGHGTGFLVRAADFAKAKVVVCRK